MRFARRIGLRGIGLSVALLSLPHAWADGTGCAIEGSIAYRESGPIVVKLLDKTQFERDIDGKESLSPFIIKIDTDSRTTGKKNVSFKFSDVLKGTYAISYYQDVNGNGKIDMGLFGPTEPWGMYRVKPIFKPVFKDEAFEVEGDIADLHLDLK
jgi:hypothetical protein